MTQILEDAGIHQIELAKLLSLNQDEFFNPEVMDFRCILPHFNHEDDQLLNQSLLEERHFSTFQLTKETCLYKGQWNVETSKPHGSGFMVLRNGDVYEGNFVDGQPYGVCRKITPEYCLEAWFLGFDCKADVKLTFRDLSCFQGKLSFHQDTIKGTLTQPDGVEHTGMFKKFSCNK